jgi:hypothetical protein
MVRIDDFSARASSSGGKAANGESNIPRFVETGTAPNLFFIASKCINIPTLDARSSGSYRAYTFQMFGMPWRGKCR